MLNIDLSKINLVLKFFIVGTIYTIIFFALKIMYKDVKNTKSENSKILGLEVINKGNADELEVGSIIPVTNELTIGRKKSNSLVIKDPYVSSNHVKISTKGDILIIEDLKSTNGVIVNNTRLAGAQKLSVDDEIKIGNIIFKVIG